MASLSSEVLEFARELRGRQYVNTVPAVKRRIQISRDLQIRAQIRKFWSLFPKIRQRLSKEHYLALNVRIAKALLPAFDVHSAGQEAQREFSADADDATSISFSRFHSFLFEVADYWLGFINNDVITIAEYVEFFERLFDSVARSRDEPPPAPRPAAPLSPHDQPATAGETPSGEAAADEAGETSNADAAASAEPPAAADGPQEDAEGGAEGAAAPVAPAESETLRGMRTALLASTHTLRPVDEVKSFEILKTEESRLAVREQQKQQQQQQQEMAQAKLAAAAADLPQPSPGRAAAAATDDSERPRSRGTKIRFMAQIDPPAEEQKPPALVGADGAPISPDPSAAAVAEGAAPSGDGTAAASADETPTEQQQPAIAEPPRPPSPPPPPPPPPSIVILQSFTGGTRPAVAFSPRQLLSECAAALGASAEVRRQAKPVCVVVLGLPSSGKTTLAKKLAAELGLAHLSLLDLLRDNLDNPDYKPIADRLRAGASLDDDLAVEVVDALVHSSRNALRGYVLDGWPASDYHAAAVPQWHPLFQPDFVFELQMPRDEAFYRLSGWQCDPEAPGTVYRRSQLQPPVRAPKPPKATADGDGEAGEEGEAAEEEGEEGGEGGAAAEFQPPDPAVLQRFVYMPELDDEHVHRLIDAASADLRMASRELLSLIANKNLYATISAVQDPAGVASHALRYFESRPPLPVPARFEMPASVSAGAEVAQVQAALQAETPGPERLYVTLSDGWGLYCPVSWGADSQLLKGDPALAVQYKGRVYVLANETALEAFTLDPERYLLVPPPPPTHLRIVVLGPPRSGQSTQARLLAERFGLELVSAEQLMQQHVAGHYPDSPLGQQALDALQQGFSVPSALYSTAVWQRLQELEVRGVPPQYGAGRGWVLDGFPRTAQEVTRLLKDGFMPHHVVILRTAAKEKASDEESDEAADGSARAASEPEPQQLNEFPFNTANFVTSLKELKKRFKRGPKPQGGGGARSPKGGSDEPEEAENPEDDTTLFKEVTISAKPEDTQLDIVAAVDPLRFGALPVEVGEDDLMPPVNADELDLYLPGRYRYGFLRRFCPVSYADSGFLVPGKTESAATYKGRVYLLASEQHRARFVASPQRFVPTAPESSPPQLPPPKLFLFGPAGSRKAAVLQQLLERHRLVRVSARDEVSRWLHSLRPVSQPTAEQLAAALQPKLSALSVLHASSDATQRRPGVVVDFDVELPAEAGAVRHLLSQGPWAVPDAVIVLNVDEGTAVERLFDPASVARPAKGENDEEADDEADPAEAAKDAIRQRLAEETEALQAVQDAAADARLPVLTFDDNARQPLVLHRLAEALKPYLDHRGSLVSYAFPLTKDDVPFLLQSHILRRSKFSKYCPVSVATCGTQLPLHTSVDYPVAYAGEVYFCESPDAVRQFVADVTRFAALPGVAFSDAPVVSPRLVVLSGAKGGATTLAKALAQRLGAERLTLSKVLRRVLWSDTHLGGELRRVLFGGGCPSPLLEAAALGQVAGEWECVSKGWVLDGYPTNSDQARLLEQAGLVPQKIFYVNVPPEQALARAQQQFAETSKFSAIEGVVKERWRQLQSDVNAVWTTFRSSYNNVFVLDGSKNKWNVSAAADAVVRTSLKATHAWVRSKETGDAVAVHGVLVPAGQFRAGQAASGLQQYCPVSLVSRGELAKCPVSPDDYLRNVVEYRGVYYVLAGPEEVAEFVQRPELYVNKQHLLPTKLPQPLEGHEVGAVIEFEGYCAVSYFESTKQPHRQPYDGLVRGDKRFAVAYDSKVYVFASEANRQQFLRNPARYAQLYLPKKLPVDKLDLPLDRLPVPGYLEQSIASLLVDSLQQLASQRPKFPAFGTRQSALRLLALFLKANNPANSSFASRTFGDKLTQYREACALPSDILSRVRNGSSPDDDELKPLLEKLDELFAGSRNSFFTGADLSFTG